MLQKFFLWMKTYERHLSALAMAAGFIADNLLFGRVDLWQTQLVFVFYAMVCFISIPLLHRLDTRATVEHPHTGWRLLLHISIQFAFGGFWSGFVIFYGRSANFSASWPFVLFLFLIFLGSEYFHRYHSRLVFTSVLFFFALYAYAIFAVPVYTGSIGTEMFLISGILAVIAFLIFTTVLRLFVRERFLSDVWRIHMGALGVLAVINIFYFTNILPPLPLSLGSAGVYHSVWRVPGAYLATSETGEPWQVRYLNFQPTLHVISGESVSVYSSVFAPTMLTTTIVHRWQWYDPKQKAWITKAVISYPIVGGRSDGYRGYSTALMSEIGNWRVDVETEDGRLITRLPFIVASVPVEPPQETVTLK